KMKAHKGNPRRPAYRWQDARDRVPLLLHRGRRRHPGWQQLLDEGAAGPVIQPDDTLLPPGRHDGAVGADAYGVKEIFVAGKVADNPTVIDIPETYGLVTAARHDLRRLAHEQQAGHLLAMACHGPDLFPFFEVPDLDGIVGAGTGQHFPVKLPA